MVNHRILQKHTLSDSSIYRISSNHKINEFIFTSPESRRICNDPFLAGIHYTSALRTACAKAIRVMAKEKLASFTEYSSVVLHILRGGLNFGLRDALSEALGFNFHSSAFVSAQRARKTGNPQDWIITESSYQKLAMRGQHDILFGDVVATGTSLEHALRRITVAAKNEHAEITSILFFTIGSPRSSDILASIDEECRSLFPHFKGSSIVYLEGVFEAATIHSNLSIKIDGTDLLRRDSLVAPEFTESQYESPSYPLERCTIYDAGSRSFDLGEYFFDVKDYWEKNLALAHEGMKFEQLLAERMPELDAQRFGVVDFKQICLSQLGKIPAGLPLGHKASE